MKKTLGEEVKAARQRARLSIRSLAEQAGVHYNTVLGIEQDRTLGVPETIGKLATVLGLEPYKLQARATKALMNREMDRAFRNIGLGIVQRDLAIRMLNEALRLGLEPVGPGSEAVLGKPVETLVQRERRLWRLPILSGQMLATRPLAKKEADCDGFWTRSAALSLEYVAYGRGFRILDDAMAPQLPAGTLVAIYVGKKDPDTILRSAEPLVAVGYRAHEVPTTAIRRLGRDAAGRLVGLPTNPERGMAIPIGKNQGWIIGQVIWAWKNFLESEEEVLPEGEEDDQGEK